MPRRRTAVQPSAAPPTLSAPPPWMTIARSYIGVHEGNGLISNPKVMRFFLEAGHPEVHDDHATPWCAAFVGAVLHEAHLPTTRSLRALDYANYGQPLATPIVGAIGTKRRAGGGHVFFVAGFDAHTVFALGGNQNDQVCIERISRAQVQSYRWPPGFPITTGTSRGGSGVAHAKEA